MHWRRLQPLGPLLLSRTSSGFVGFGLDAKGERLVKLQLEPDGSPEEPPVALSATGSSAFDFAMAAGQMLVVWTEWASVTGGDIYARLLDTTGSALNERTLLAESARPQHDLAMASAGPTLMSVWGEGVEGNSQIHMSILRGLTSLEREAAVHPSEMEQTRPAVAFNGDDYLVVWEEHAPPGTAIFSKRFSSGGLPRDETPLVLTNHRCGMGRPVVVSNGRDFLVTFTECSDVGTRPEVVALRIVDGVKGDRIVLSAARSP